MRLSIRRRRHLHFLRADLDVVGIEILELGVAQLVGPVHGLHDDHTVLGAQGRQLLLLPDGDLGDAHPALVTERLFQYAVGLDPRLLRSQVVGRLVEHRVDLLLVDELDDVYEFVPLGVDGLQLIVGEDHITVLLELVALDDVVPLHFLAIRLGDPLVADRRVVGLPQLLELGCLVVSGRVEADRDRDQPEVDGALPDCSWHVRDSIYPW